MQGTWHHDVNVMIADDSTFMRNMLRNILEHVGYKVIAEARDGNEAVEAYIKFRPDVTLMDVFMPLKNGLEATADIVSFDNFAKVVLCSTLDREVLAMSALRVGAKDIVCKPYEADDINKVINRLMLTR